MNAETTHAKPMGLVVFLATVTMLFTAFTASYVIRRTSDDWVPLSMPATVWLGAALLAAGSVSIERARSSPERWIALTLAIAAAFLVVQAVAWRQLAGQGVFLQSHPGASFFYILTGIHGLHVLGGVGALLAAWRRPALLGSCRLYWHYLGGLWVYVLILLSVF